MNMQNLMAQAQKMQRELEKVTNEIENTVFEGESGVVKIKIKGNYEVLEVVVLDNIDDNDMLSDMILVATNDALSKIKKLKSEKLGKYTGGLGGLF